MSIINNSNINKININKKLLFVKNIVIITNGSNITSAFVIILAVSLLVTYSSSMFNISSLLLNFKTYFLRNGILEYVKYNFWYITSEEYFSDLVPCCNFCILLYSDFCIFLANI